LLLIALPVIALAIWYFASHHGEARADARIPFPELLQWIVDGRPFITFGYDELSYSRPIGWAIMIAAIGVAAVPKLSAGAITGGRRIWLAAALGSMALAFLLPDAMASGRILTPRLMLFAWLFAAIGLASVELRSWVRIPVLAVVLVADLFALRNQIVRTGELNADVEEYTAITAGLAPGTVLLPLNYSDNWFHSNFICYAGAATGAIVLDNFVAATPTSPLIWHPEALPYDAIGTFASSNTPCVRLDGYRQRQGIAVDRVSTWAMRPDLVDSCTVDVRTQLAATADTMVVSPHARAVLYRLR
jgi:hypothetical protein